MFCTFISGTVRLFHKFKGGHLERGRKRGGGKNLQFFGQ